MKKNHIIKISIVMFFAIIILFGLDVKSYAGTQSWNSLDYDVTLNSDGSMNVVETWNINIAKTNTLFKNFDMPSGIIDAKVSLVENGVEKQLKQIYQEQEHVDPGCFYSLPIKNNKFEIAWNVGLDNSKDTRTYKLYYKVKNAVKVYRDCAEFYWMFLGTNNGISGKNITGTIHLPSKVSNIEKLRVWAHGDLSGEIERTSTDTVKFSLPRLPKGKMLEVRVVTEENIYTESLNVDYSSKLQKILYEEGQWADNANAERNSARNAVYVAIIANIIFALFFALKIKKYKKIAEEFEIKFAMPEYKLDYFREIPDEKNATPGKAMYISLYGAYNSYIDSPALFSATILDLCLKNFIQFEIINEKNIKIYINKEKEILDLPEDEKVIYELLLKAVGNNSHITMKDFQAYAKENYEEFLDEIKSIEPIIEKFEKENGNVDLEKEKILKKYNFKFVIYLGIFIFSCFAYKLMKIIPAYYIGLFASFYVCQKKFSNFTALSEKGYKEKVEWLALKKYMKDYSLLKEKKVPDIVLWEKFLVYATAFEISKEVIDQLKVVHPEMFVESYSENNVASSYGYWNLISNNVLGDKTFEVFGRELNKVYNKASSAYSAAHSSDSSGSGSGGGFSSGGGGRRRRRRLRWSLK